MEGEDLIIVKLTDEQNFQRSLEKALNKGLPLLIEDIAEDLDPALDSVLGKAFFEVEGMRMIKLGEKDITCESY